MAPKLGQQAAELLLDTLEPDLGLLDQELAGALSAGADGTIDPQLVRELVGGWRTKTTWDMLDLAAAGHAGEAILQLDRPRRAARRSRSMLSRINATEVCGGGPDRRTGRKRRTPHNAQARARSGRFSLIRSRESRDTIAPAWTTAQRATLSRASRGRSGPQGRQFGADPSAHRARTVQSCHVARSGCSGSALAETPASNWRPTVAGRKIDAISVAAPFASFTALTACFALKRPNYDEPRLRQKRLCLILRRRMSSEALLSIYVSSTTPIDKPMRNASDVLRPQRVDTELTICMDSL